MDLYADDLADYIYQENDVDKKRALLLKVEAEIKFGYSVGAKQINFAVLVACDTEHGIAEQAVRIILFVLEAFDVVTVITVQPFARTCPYNAPFVNI